MLTFGRVTAAAVGIGTFVFLFRNDGWRADNLFLVPDLVLSAALLAAALAPARWARRALLITLGFAAGVLACAAASYLVDGRLGVASLIGAVSCAGVGLLLLLRSSEAADARVG